jgi:uncharacterized protein (TIGR03067 family)
MLRERLARRGLPSAAVAAALASSAAPASLPPPLLLSTSRAATARAAGTSAGLVSSEVVTLKEGVLRTMSTTRLKIAAGLVLVLSLLGGLGVLGHGIGDRTAVVSGQEPAPAPKRPDDAKPATSVEQKELAALKGAWVLASYKIHGEQPKIIMKPLDWSFEDRKAISRWVLVEHPDSKQEGSFASGHFGFTFTIDPAKSPKEITFTITRNGSGQMLGIYQLDRDTLTLAMYHVNRETRRPKGFSAKDAGDGSVLMCVLKRKVGAK